jgi:hypothetical protein
VQFGPYVIDWGHRNITALAVVNELEMKIIEK